MTVGTISLGSGVDAVVTAPEGHDEKMAALFEERAATPGGTDAATASAEAVERPEWLPEGFKTPEEFRAAYDKLSTTEAKPEGEAEAKEPEVPDAAKQLEEKGFSLSDLEAEWRANGGKLTDASRDALISKGFNEADIQTYAAGREAQAKVEIDSITGALGGAEKFAEVLEWAKTGVSEAEGRAFNSAMDRATTIEEKQLVAAGLHAKYVSANGSAPNLVRVPSAQANTEAYVSRAQLTADMRDPRYKSDPAFRARVASKLERSEVF